MLHCFGIWVSYPHQGSNPRNQNGLLAGQAGMARPGQAGQGGDSGKYRVNIGYTIFSRVNIGYPTFSRVPDIYLIFT